MKPSTRLLLAAVTIAALALATGALLRALAPAEVKIRRLVRSMAEGFDASRPSAALRGLAEDFRDRETGLTRGELRGLLVRFFLAERGRQSGRFLWRVELADDEPQVEVSPDGASAEATLEPAFLRLPDGVESDGEEREVWRVRIRATLRRGDDGWRILAAERETIDGRMPF
jgi:hypothetical protein